MAAMNFQALNVVKINEEALLDAPVFLEVLPSNIKFVFPHTPESPYDLGLVEVIYYDEQASTLAHVVAANTMYSLLTGQSDQLFLITAESIDGIKVTKPMLLNLFSFGYRVALSPKDPNYFALVKHGSETGGTFTVGDIVTGQTTFATARVLYDSGFNTMYVHPIKGTLSGSEVIKSSDGLVTATMTSYTAAPQAFMQYELGLSTSARKQDIIGYVQADVEDLAITGVDVLAKTFTVSGNVHDNFILDTPFFVVGSTGNDGVYTVISSYYTGSDTVIFVRQTIADSTADGNIKTA